jgi:hypothetical protein
MAGSPLSPAVDADRVYRDGRVVRPDPEDPPPRLGESLPAEPFE